MIFSNSYFPLTFPRPLLPDIVEVGGMHCRPAQPLPKDLDDFLTGAEHGFIYFSMGSVLQTDQMPEEMRQKFLNVFSRLKQRVLWKWNSGEMPNVPSNVKLSSWLPQQDILGHPNIRIFMTHGGLLSSQEAAYHGVPLIGIPMFADQDLNTQQAVSNGYAVFLEILDLSEELLDSLINEVLNEPKYSNRAKELSAVIRDQMETPLERAVFWTEYVIRHRGAVHLRSAARKLNFIQYHSIDVFGFISAVLIVLITSLVVLLKFAYKKICKKSNRVDEKKKGQ
jgi:glucuronosyltransferase